MKRSRMRPMSLKRAAGRGAYTRVVNRVFTRAKGQCEVVLDGARCARRAKDPHHVLKRSQGGEDVMENLIAVCRTCHDRTDAAYSDGRLTISANGDGTFRCAIVFAPSKFRARRDPFFDNGSDIYPQSRQLRTSGSVDDVSGTRESGGGRNERH